MEMEKEALMPPEAKSGRDYIEVINAIKAKQPEPPYDPEASIVIGEFEKERIAAIQVGDYIEMSVKQFKSWVAFDGATDGDQDSLGESGNIKVEIQDIIPADKDTSLKLVVKAGGVTKTIHGSLFYNYGIHFAH